MKHSANKIIAISAGREFYKDKGEPFANDIAYLNYGLLGLCTMLYEHGLDVEMYHGYEGPLPDCSHILLSIPSNYSLSWCEKFCETVPPGPILIVGGRWVVDGNVEWLKQKMPRVDMFIEGFGESKIASLFGFDMPDGSTQCFPHLEYPLLHNYLLYQPIIEVSRGCGSGCMFCADRCNKRLSNKSVPQIITEMNYLDSLYGNDYKLYFEAPHFIFEKEWVDSYYSAVIHRHRVVPWRCTSRVETVPISDVELSKLARSGLKIIDVGLESASPTQLMRMHKSRHPDEYLKKADLLLRQCHKYGIWIKLNILLYVGETHDTLRETENWLLERKELIKGISCANFMVYRNSNTTDISIADKEKFDKYGFSGVNLSSEIDLQEALYLCHSLTEKLTSLKDYYDLKEHSYLRRDRLNNKF